MPAKLKIKRVKLGGNLIWFIAILSSVAFHALVVFALTFVLREGHIRIDNYAQLSPIQFVLLSGEVAQIPSVVESALSVNAEAETELNPVVEAYQKAEEQPNPIKEVFEKESAEEKTNVEEDHHPLEDILVVKDGVLEIDDVNDTLLSDTLEAQEVSSESLAQQGVYSSSQSRSEKRATPTTHTASEQSVSDAHSSVSKAGSQGSYEAVTEAYAMFALNRPPPYPIMARRNEWEGEVVLEIVVSPSGECKRAEVITSSGYQILDRAAVKAAQHWKFVPAMRNDIPVKSTVLVPVVFRLNQR
ncbi:MAG: energy transducer TonB [Candidatus Brocadiales bacterium]